MARYAEFTLDRNEFTIADGAITFGVGFTAVIEFAGDGDHGFTVESFRAIGFDGKPMKLSAAARSWASDGIAFWAAEDQRRGPNVSDIYAAYYDYLRENPDDPEADRGDYERKLHAEAA